MMNVFRTSMMMVFLALLASVPAQASVTFYTNESDFLANTNSLSSFDFNSETVGSFLFSDFGDFTATHIDEFNDFEVGIAGGGAGTNIDSTSHLYFTTTEPTTGKIALDFNPDVGAFGFDWQLADTVEGFVIVVNGESFHVQPGSILGDSGFLGIVAGAGSIIEANLFLQDDDVGNQGNRGVGFDNFLYGGNGSSGSNGSGTIPEPGSFVIFGAIGLLAAGGQYMRRRKQAA